MSKKIGPGPSPEPSRWPDDASLAATRAIVADDPNRYEEDGGPFQFPLSHGKVLELIDELALARKVVTALESDPEARSILCGPDCNEPLCAAVTAYR